MSVHGHGCWSGSRREPPYSPEPGARCAPSRPLALLCAALAFSAAGAVAQDAPRPRFPGPEAAPLIVGATVKLEVEGKGTWPAEVQRVDFGPPSNGMVVRRGHRDSTHVAPGTPLQVSAGVKGDYRWWAALIVPTLLSPLVPQSSDQGSFIMLPVAVLSYLLGKSMKRHDWVDAVVP